jgi:hypothetical protein
LKPVPRRQRPTSPTIATIRFFCTSCGLQWIRSLHRQKPPGVTGKVVSNPEIKNADSPLASFVAPKSDTPRTLHVILAVTPLTRYRRVIVTLKPAR